MSTSPDTLLRLVRGFTPVEENRPRVVGVDDFALQKGHIYATLLVDLERRQPIDLLPDRTADTLAEWLRSHPGIEIITRDRSTEYARGASEGAPEAVQVVDRWHLLKNMRETLERLLNRSHSRLQQLSRTPEVSALLEQPKRKLSRQEQWNQQAKRDRRYKQYQEVKDLYEQGLPILEIAKQLGISRTTVRRFAYSTQFPERAQKGDVPGLLTPYLKYLQQRLEEGCDNSSQLYREIQSQGFSGSRKQVARWILQRRKAPAKTIPIKYIRPIGERVEKQASLAAPRQLVWLLLKSETRLEKDEQIILGYIRQDPEVNVAYLLGQEFQQMIRERRPEALDKWLAGCAKSELIDLQNFASGLRQDLPAVRSALQEPWSNGQTEGQVTRLKLLKRQMYGRANLDLLRQRVLFSG
jgi:transposase